MKKNICAVRGYFLLLKIPTMVESGNASRPFYRGGTDIVGFIL